MTTRILTGIVLVILGAVNARADSAYRCKMNAWGGRHYQHTLVETKQWCGERPCNQASPFEAVRFSSANFDDTSYREYALTVRDKGRKVGIKSFWGKDEAGKSFSEEFEAGVVSSDGSVLMMVYLNPTGNKLHSYALDLKRKVLLSSSVENGITAISTVARTFDCE
ncbi:MAG: hypothetical protein HYZ75_04505 [Elusimicrobia bacterium]|nr:hypothetical protein [Elusimicrobiota bacterium]